MRLERGLLVGILCAAAIVRADDPETASTTTIRESGISTAVVKQRVSQWQECDEYISVSPCKVTVNLSNVPIPDPSKSVSTATGTTEDQKTHSDTNGAHGPFMPHAHWDVQVPPFKIVKRKIKPAGEAAVMLKHSSPFMSCTVAAVPAAPTRDLSTNIGSLLTAVAGIGAPSVAPPPPTAAELALRRLDEENFNSPLVTLQAINDRIGAVRKRLERLSSGVDLSFPAFGAAVKENWKFSFASDAEAVAAIKRLKDAADGALMPMDDFIKLGGEINLVDSALTRYAKDHSAPDEQNAIRDAADSLVRLKTQADLLKTQIANYGDQQKLVLQVKFFIAKLEKSALLPENVNDRTFYTVQVLPMSYFTGKSVTEMITCKDAITKDPAFDNIIFTGYYEALPHLDISVGAIASLLGGRQEGTVTGPLTPQQAAACAPMSTPPCGPSTLLVDTSKSAYQFMPGVFGEWRWKNFHLPWVENGAPWHPLGYVGSIGVAGGIAINPNNGGPAAEFFEGLSIGIQRFSILVGVHNGRYQQSAAGTMPARLLGLAHPLRRQLCRNGPVIPLLASLTASRSVNFLRQMQLSSEFQGEKFAC